MSNPTLRGGITQFLSNRKSQSDYLISRWSPDLETQIVVHAGSNESDGNNKDEDSAVWSDGEQTWFNARWPKNAWAQPYYKDRPLTFSLSTHLKCIGSTWWSWERQRSVAVVFDVDAKAGHSSSTNTCTPEQLEQLVEGARSLPYITLVRSKSGGGYHVYCFFNPDDLPVTKNHNEHASLAGVVLERMTKDSGFEFSKFIDVKGGNFWIWASEIGDHGFELVQEAVQNLGAEDFGDWQANVLATSNRPVIMDGFTESGESTRERSSGGGFQVYDLDEEHKEILRALEDLPYSFRWLPQYNMAHTHTAALKALYEQRKGTDKPLLGLFDTVSGGSDHRKPNCFISPRPDGVFRVSRFGNGTTEHPLWDTHEGKTWCYYNQPTDSRGILQKIGGSDLSFTPTELESALQIFGKSLGPNLAKLKGHVKVGLNKNKTVFYAKVSISETDGDLEGWTKKGKSWYCTLPLEHDKDSHTRNVLEEVDKICRYVRSPERQRWGWAHYTRQEDWMVGNTYEEVACIMNKRFGYDAANEIKAYMVLNPWTLEHIPFANEYPGSSELRLWNKDTPQLAYSPAEEPGPHPHWDLILNHLGTNLNGYVKKSEWCQQWGITNGGDYLRYWVTCLIKHPFVPLPYLFFFGPQNCGKSTLFEALTLLFTPGSVVSAGTSLISQAGFNSELVGAVVAYIDEKDLSQSGKPAYERIKEWTMAETIPIHTKGKPQYQRRNTLHFIQVGNGFQNLPVEDGDTRITAIEVTPFQGSIIPKNKLFDKLREEAPFFLRTLVTTALPDQIGRTRLPVLETDAKSDLQKMNQNSAEAFAADRLYMCDGMVITIKDLYEVYVRYCNENSHEPEGAIVFGRRLKTRSDKYAVGRAQSNVACLGNYSLKREAPVGERLIVNDRGRLVPQSEAACV